MEFQERFLPSFHQRFQQAYDGPAPLKLVLFLVGGLHKGRPIGASLDIWHKEQGWPLGQIRDVCRALRIEYTSDPYANLRDACPALPWVRCLWEIFDLPALPWLQGWRLDPIVALLLVAEMQRWLQRQARRGDGWSIWPASASNKPEIVATIENHLSLIRAGEGYRGRCPFHQERTASFFVWPKSQRWRCFGACATGGDVLDFLKRMKELGDGGGEAETGRWNI